MVKTATVFLLIGLIFWFVMRAIIRADRGERKAYARIEAEESEQIGDARARRHAGSDHRALAYRIAGVAQGPRRHRASRHSTFCYR